MPTTGLRLLVLVCWDREDVRRGIEDIVIEEPGRALDVKLVLFEAELNVYGIVRPSVEIQPRDGNAVVVDEQVLRTITVTVETLDQGDTSISSSVLFA